MKVIFHKIVTGYVKPGNGWSKGFVQATVDGFPVVFREAHGWDCRCPDLDCLHIDAVADLIDDDVLEHIEAGRIR